MFSQLRDEERFGLVDGTLPKTSDIRSIVCVRFSIGLCVTLFCITLIVLSFVNYNDIFGSKSNDVHAAWSNNGDVNTTNLTEGKVKAVDDESIEEDTLHLFKQNYRMFIASNNYSLSSSSLLLDKAILTESALYCDENTVNNLPEVEQRIKRADCGMGYDYLNSSARTKPWKVMLYGDGWSHMIVNLLGCPIGDGRCPLSPKCSIEIVPTTSPTTKLSRADLILLFQKEANALVNNLPEKEITLPDGTKKRIYRVFYWREAQWIGPSRDNQLKFDFELGVHYRSAIPDPYFFNTPREYLSLLGSATLGRLYPNTPSSIERVHFAMSVISHCNADSMRDQFQSALISYLGEERVHRYGRCGNRVIPAKSLHILFRYPSSLFIIFHFWYHQRHHDYPL